MIRDDIATERRQMLREWSDRAERSHQRELGWSEIGHDCWRYPWNVIHGVPATNPEQRVLASIRGTAVHQWLEPMFGAAGWNVEETVEWLGLLGHADLNGSGIVEDTKTGDADAARALRSHGPERKWRWQVQGYARALVEKGIPIHTVRITLYATDTSDEITVWEEPFDPAISDEAIAHRDRLVEQDEPPKPGKDAEWCRDWCKFFDENMDKGGCPGRLLGDDPVVIDDPVKLSAVADLKQARLDAKDVKLRKGAATEVLTGVEGVAGDVKVRTVYVTGSQEVDVAAVDWDSYEAIVGEIPMRTSAGYSYVSLSKARQAK